MNKKPEYKNPFIYNTPVRGKNFFGRDDLLRKIFDSINLRQHVSLVGERRTGKTSILHRVLDIKQQRLREPSQHLLVLQDFLGIDCRTQADVWVVLLTTLSEEMARSGLHTKSVIQVIEQLQSGKSILSSLRKFFALLLKDGYKVTFLFDEFEATANEKNPIDLSFYKILRNLALDNYTKVSYLIATRQPLSDVEKSVEQKFTARSSPFYNIFTGLLIEPFSSDEAALMVNGLLKSTTLSFRTRLSFWLQRDFLFQLSGFHPFFLQRACYHLFESCVLPDGTFATLLPKEEIINAFLKDSIAHFEYYWEISSIREQKIMKRLAAGQAIDWEPVIDVRRTLQNRCLIIQAESDWQLFSSPFAKWVNEQQIMAKAAYQPPVRWAGAYDFVNREEDLSQLSALLKAHPYLHLYGASGIGKTHLIQQLLEKRYPEHDTVYLDFNERKFRAESRSVEDLLREIERQLYNIESINNFKIKKIIYNISLKIIEKSQYGIVILDNIDGMAPTIRNQLREKTLPALQDRIADPTLYLRFIAISETQLKEFSGRGRISFEAYRLAEFRGVVDDLNTYKKLLRQAVERWGDQKLDRHDSKDNDLLRRWANELYDLTGGHPGAIEGTLNYVGRQTQFARPSVFEEQRHAICLHVLTPLVEEQVQASLPSLPKHLQAFQKLWIFRYLSIGIFRQVLKEIKGKPHWGDLNTITREDDYIGYPPLWGQLNKTPLLQGRAPRPFLSHSLTPIWRQLGNLILQVANPSLYHKLHGDAKVIFQKFANNNTLDTSVRMDCFIEELYHFTQEISTSSSPRTTVEFTKEVVKRLEEFLSTINITSDDFFDEPLYKLNDLLESDQELPAELNRIGQPDTQEQLIRIIERYMR